MTPEIYVFMKIESIGAFTWRMEHDMADGRIPEQEHAAIDKDVQRLRGEALELARGLTAYGLVEPLRDDKPTAEYWAWYSWWKAWLNSHSDDEWRRIEPLIIFDMPEHLQQRLRPAGSWRDTFYHQDHEPYKQIRVFNKWGKEYKWLEWIDFETGLCEYLLRRCGEFVLDQEGKFERRQLRIATPLRFMMRPIEENHASLDEQKASDIRDRHAEDCHA